VAPSWSRSGAAYGSRWCGTLAVSAITSVRRRWRRVSLQRRTACSRTSSAAISGSFEVADSAASGGESGQLALAAADARLDSAVIPLAAAGLCLAAGGHSRICREALHFSVAADGGEQASMAWV
jgi:hypothetical protein